MISQNFSEVLLKWESEEHSVEEKLNHLRDYILRHVGLKKEISYYFDNGKFHERFIAGFIDRYFLLLKDISFILLDPLHIFEIITAFVKNLFLHPLKTAKNIWSMWSWYYTHGPYSLGYITADALLACFIAGAHSILSGSEAGTALQKIASTARDTTMDNIAYLPRKFQSIAISAEKTVENYKQIFGIILEKPHQILADAKITLKSGISYGTIRTYKYYADPYMKHHTLN